MRFSWRPRSVRTRLTLWYAFALTVALAVYAGLIYLLLWQLLLGNFNRQLALNLDLGESGLEAVHGHLQWEEEFFPKGQDLPPIEILSANGKVLFRSATYPLEGRTGLRTLQRIAHIEDMPGVVSIRAATSMNPIREELGLLALVLIGAIPFVVLLADLGGFFLAKRALAPVDEMATQASAITAARLSARLHVENRGDELGHLALAFNRLFERLQNSFEQLQRFTADASHELRTPLTIMRSVGEVGLAERRTPEEYREILGSMLEEVDYLGRLVESLLTLSRADGGQVQLKVERSELGQLAEEVVQQLAVLAEEKHQTLRCVRAEAPLSIDGDRLVLQQALVNLIDNAIKYSPAEARIDVVAKKTAAVGMACIEVIDNGPGIAAEDVLKIFERFYRVHKSRARQSGGTGLGLAIARWAVESHGGRLEVESKEGQGTVFRMVLPVARNQA